MAEIVAHFTNQGVPLVAPTDIPTIRIRRTDTGALIATDLAMTELGDGSFRFTFAAAEGLDYAIRADGDPLINGQVTAAERYQFGSLGELMEQLIEGTTTFKETMRLMAGVLGGKNSGVGTVTEVFRDFSDTKDRLTATIDAGGNRTAIATDLS